MPRAALALLAMLAVSCSTERSQEALVDVEGTASLRNGPPLAGMSVFFHTPFAAGQSTSPLAPEEPGRRHLTPPLEMFTIIDAQGRFRIRLPEGRWEVFIGGPVDSGIMGQRMADVALRAPRAHLDLHYQGFRVSGRVTGPSGPVHEGADLFILSSTNTALAAIHSGNYTFLVPPDSLMIWATPDSTDHRAGIPRVRFDGIVATSDTLIDLSLDGNLVSGRVRSSGAPASGGWVAADASNSTASAYMPTAMDGTYHLYLPTREYVFRVAASPGDPTYYPPMLIDAPRTLDFDLPGSP